MGFSLVGEECEVYTIHGLHEFPVSITEDLSLWQIIQIKESG